MIPSLESNLIVRSFEKIDYSLRPNKNIERKLLADMLADLGRVLPISSYGYIGFGSMWFSDFLLFHRRFGFRRMTTIEQERSRASRVEFNAPFAIDIRMGSALRVLPMLPLADFQHVVWLDYDGVLSREVLDDIDIVCRDAKIGTVLLVSVNANREDLRTNDAQGRVEPEAILRKEFGDLVPRSDDPKESARMFGGNISETLAKILFAHCRRSPRIAGRAEQFVPLCNFAYSDGARMITVGGLIADNELVARIQEARIGEPERLFGSDVQVRIEAPLLTPREKLAFDQAMPRDPSVPLELPFELRDTERDAYVKFYRHYPLFGEFFS